MHFFINPVFAGEGFLCPLYSQNIKLSFQTLLTTSTMTRISSSTFSLALHVANPSNATAQFPSIPTMEISAA